MAVPKWVSLLMDSLVPEAHASNANPLTMPDSHLPQFVRENPDIAGESYKQGQMGVFKDPIKEHLRTKVPVTNFYPTATEVYPSPPDMLRRDWRNIFRANDPVPYPLQSGHEKNEYGETAFIQRKPPERNWWATLGHSGDPNANWLDWFFHDSPDPRSTSVPLSEREQHALRVAMYNAALAQDPSFDPDAFWLDYTRNIAANPWMQDSMAFLNEPFYTDMPYQNKARILFSRLGAKYGPNIKNTPVLGPYYQNILK